MVSTLYTKFDRRVSELMLQQFVKDEVRAERDQVYQAYHRPLALRVQEGICLARLKFLFEAKAGGYVYQFKDSAGSFQFVEQDLVVINDGEPEGEAIADGVLMWISEINHSARTLTLEYAIELPDEKEPPTDRERDYILDKGFFDFNSASLLNAASIAFNSEPQLQALLQGEWESDNARQTQGASNIFYLSSLLSGSRDARAMHSSTTETNSTVIEQMPRELDMALFTERQRQAYENCSRQSFTLIQGPPGTGKTHLLAQIVVRALNERKRVLVSAYTHAAINNLLEAVAAIDAAAGKVCKLTGRARSRALPASIEQIEFDVNAVSQRLAQPVVIGATAYQAYKLRQFELPPFDLVIIDEAAQMPIPHALAAMICGQDYVLAGDHKQLPPILKAHEPEDEVAKSIFERLHSLYPHLNVTLDVTFRMNAGINEFPNKTFYSGQLKPSDDAARRRFNHRIKDCSLPHITTRDEAVTFVEVDHSSASKLSRVEAQIVAELACSLLVEHEIPASELGIISAHRQHNNEIRKKIERLLSDLEGWPVKSTMKQLTIDTVEKMQGREREVVILSLCSSKRSYLKARAHFLFKPNRLNVAITRSRSKLFVVGSRHFFPAASKVSMNPKHAKIFDDYHDYLKERRVLFASDEE